MVTLYGDGDDPWSVVTCLLTVDSRCHLDCHRSGWSARCLGDVFVVCTRFGGVLGKDFGESF